MSFEARIEDCAAIPHPTEWYAREPFDPSVVAFNNADGSPQQYMNSPLDEVYAVEPGDSYRAGSIPPEEREVRDTLLVTVAFRNRVSWFDFWWSQFGTPTAAYRTSLDCFQRLSALCAKSRAYRAAFCRLSNGEALVPGLRSELKRIVDLCDQGKL